MTEEDAESSGALVVDEDQDEILEEMSLDERKERLKKARWNVFLYLGIAVILFGFALFPMPFSADYEPFSSSAEKDVGYVWGLPLDGPDLFDVPMRLTVTAEDPPAVAGLAISVFVIQEPDCTDVQTMSEKVEEAKGGDAHDHQHAVSDADVQVGGEYEFEFNIDPGQYCVVVEYVKADGTKISDSAADLSVEGKLYPNQLIGGVLGFVCLGLSTFAFIGAQRHGQALRTILESDGETTETKVLSAASAARIAAGPAGGPPQGGPSGPPSNADVDSTADHPAGPPQEQSADAPEAAPVAAPSEGDQAVFEPAENGYFFRKMPDGTYDQTVYVQDAEGTFVPYQA